MVLIFSSEAIDGLDGTYARPSLFDGDFGKARVVYTNDKNIAKQASEKHLEVRSIKKFLATEEVMKTPEPVKEEKLFAEIKPETPAATFTTTVEEDIEAGMSNEAIIAKHGIEKKELTKIKRKLTMAKKNK